MELVSDIAPCPSTGISVLVITGIFPPDIGGPATYVPAIGRELARLGHKVTVITLSENPRSQDRSCRVRVVRLPRKMFKPLRLFLTVATILRFGRQAHVLYVNGLYLESTLANIFLRKPQVEKLVGDWAWERATNLGWVKDNFEEFQTRRYGLKIEALKTVRNYFVSRADAVIVPSRYLACWVGGWGISEKKLAVIYNAVDLPVAHPATIRLPTPIKVVTVGRLVPWKQVDTLITAVAKCPEIGLVIVGDGPERGHLEQLARSQNLTDRVYFAGQKDWKETLSLMAACDLFVLNSTYEGFPHVVLEAMSVGLPVVATAVGGTPEVVRDGENGVLITPGANGLLSDTIVKLSSSPAERVRLAAGAKCTAQRFRRSAMVDETETVLKACAHVLCKRWADTPPLRLV